MCGYIHMMHVYISMIRVHVQKRGHSERIRADASVDVSDLLQQQFLLLLLQRAHTL